MRARSVRIDGDAGTLVHLDGEPFGGLPVTVHLQPAALHVTTADGVRPADD
jgi:diacylglycerol kinase family enzyme